jgi:beta-galactosidase
MLGVCYYPEHWEFERIEKDLDIMKKNGLKIIRIAEFMWSVLEKEEGKFDFSILDKVFEEVEKRDMKIILGTPSATPPAWIIRKHPEIMQKDEHGKVRNFGSRRHYCYNSGIYQKYINIIVEKMAIRYGKSVVLHSWQIDNEFGCENTSFCYCEDCDKEFSSHLKSKYENIEKLNEIWGTKFWSQDYNEFNQVETPKKTNAFPNPHHVLDYYRFTTESINNFSKNQIEIIKKFSNAPITHNFMVNWKDINYLEHAKLYDYISYDNYMPQDNYDPMVCAFNFELIYALKNKEFVVMEQQPGRVNWQLRNFYYPAEWLIPATKQAFLHGAKELLYFRYRALPYGAEQYHNAIVNYSGKEEDSERLEIVKNISSEISALKKSEHNDIALFFDYESMWMNIINHVSKDFDYIKSMIEIYSAFRKNGHNVNVVFRNSKIDDYKVLVIPFTQHIPDEFKAKIENFKGKILINSFFNFKDKNSHINKKWEIDFYNLKIKFLDYGAISEGKIKLEDKILKADFWQEKMSVLKGKVWGNWEDTNMKGFPAIILSEDERLMYVSSVFDRSGYLELFKKWFKLDVEIPEGIEVIEDYTLNFTNEEKILYAKKLFPYSATL